MGKLSDLPTDIVVEILSRLPTETVLECKLVCKPWRNLVSNPSFSQMHLNHLTDHGKLTFLSSTYHDRDTKHRKFHYFEHNDDDTYKITRINIKPPFEKYLIVGSCNGLICLSAHPSDIVFDFQPAYICNPVTREYVVLPEIHIDRNKIYYVRTGFGYLHETNVYKAVRMIQLCGEPIARIEVYTLGGGDGWRNVGEYEISCSLASFTDNNGVFERDTLHWITENGKIMAFNLADEKFYEHPTLPCLLSLANTWVEFCNIGVLGGVLWCSIPQCEAERTDIWLLKRTGSQNMMVPEEYFSVTWSEKFIYMQPLALLKSGEVLLFDYAHVYSYHIKSSCLKTMFNFPEYVHQTIPHMNTLVSLKALGEVDITTME